MSNIDHMLGLWHCYGTLIDQLDLLQHEGECSKRQHFEAKSILDYPLNDHVFLTRFHANEFDPANEI